MSAGKTQQIRVMSYGPMLIMLALCLSGCGHNDWSYRLACGSLAPGVHVYEWDENCNPIRFRLEVPGDYNVPTESRLVWGYTLEPTPKDEYGFFIHGDTSHFSTGQAIIPGKQKWGKVK